MPRYAFHDVQSGQWGKTIFLWGKPGTGPGANIMEIDYRIVRSSSSQRERAGALPVHGAEQVVAGQPDVPFHPEGFDAKLFQLRFVPRPLGGPIEL